MVIFRRFRLGLILLTVVSLLGMGAGAAWACNEPRLDPSPDTAGPNDPVGFTITGTDPGAAYTVTIEGQTVASGTDGTQAAGTTGSFTMPDLGSESRTVYLEAVVQHDGSQWKPPATMQYQAVPTPPPDDSDQGPAPGGDTPSEQGSPGGHRSSDAVNQDAISAVPTPAPAAAPVPAAAPSTGSPVADEPAFVGSTAAVEAETPESVRHAARQANEEDESTWIPLPRAPEALTGETEIGDVTVANEVLLALALLAVLGLGGGGLVFVLARRLGPDPQHVAAEVARGFDEMEIEAELQEIIAEERARRELAADREKPVAPDMELERRVRSYLYG